MCDVNESISEPRMTMPASPMKEGCYGRKGSRSSIAGGCLSYGLRAITDSLTSIDLYKSIYYITPFF